MSVNLISSLFLAVIFLAGGNAAADELVLKEGKTLSGKITGEDARQYTILLGSNMVLRVDKNKVVKVVRTAPPAKPARPTIRTSDVAAIKTSTKTSTTPTASTPSTPAAPVVSNIPALQVKSGVETTSTANGNVKVEKSVVTSTVAVRGPEPSVIKTSWAVAWTGEAEGGQWKWAVVRATITNVMPRWEAPAKAEPKTVEAWNNFLSKAGVHSAGKTGIYSQSIESFAAELAQLRSKDEATLRQESKQLFEAMKARAAKQQEGHERRTKKIFDTKPK